MELYRLEIERQAFKPADAWKIDHKLRMSLVERKPTAEWLTTTFDELMKQVQGALDVINSMQDYTPGQDALSQLKQSIDRIIQAKLLIADRHAAVEKPCCIYPFYWCYGRVFIAVDSLVGLGTLASLIVNLVSAYLEAPLINATQPMRNFTTQTPESEPLNLSFIYKVGLVLLNVIASKIRDSAFKRTVKKLEAYTLLTDVLITRQAGFIITELKAIYRWMRQKKALHQPLTEQIALSSRFFQVLSYDGYDISMPYFLADRTQPADATERLDKTLLSELANLDRRFRQSKVDVSLIYQRAYSKLNALKAGGEVSFVDEVEDLKIEFEALGGPINTIDALDEHQAVRFHQSQRVKTIRMVIQSVFDVLCVVFTLYEGIEGAFNHDVLWLKWAVLISFVAVMIYSHVSSGYHILEARRLEKVREIKRLLGGKRHLYSIDVLRRLLLDIQGYQNERNPQERMKKFIEVYFSLSSYSLKCNLPIDISKLYVWMISTPEGQEILALRAFPNQKMEVVAQDMRERELTYKKLKRKASKRATGEFITVEGEGSPEGLSLEDEKSAFVPVVKEDSIFIDLKAQSQWNKNGFCSHEDDESVDGDVVEI